MTYWLIIGPPSNWEIGLKNKMWSLSERYKKFWVRLQPGDYLLFYATAPVKGVIGSGVVSKIKNVTKPFWPQEVKEGKLLWPLKIEFDDIKFITKKQWENDKIPVERQGVTFQRALQQVPEERGQNLVNALQKALVKKIDY
jgi:predicted RNA-binding protein